MLGPIDSLLRSLNKRTMQEVAFRQDQVFCRFATQTWGTSMVYKTSHAGMLFSIFRGIHQEQDVIQQSFMVKLEPTSLQELPPNVPAAPAVKRPAQTQAGRSLAATPWGPKKQGWGDGVVMGCTELSPPRRRKRAQEASDRSSAPWELHPATRQGRGFSAPWPPLAYFGIQPVGKYHPVMAWDHVGPLVLWMVAALPKASILWESLRKIYVADVALYSCVVLPVYKQLARVFSYSSLSTFLYLSVWICNVYDMYIYPFVFPCFYSMRKRLVNPYLRPATLVQDNPPTRVTVFGLCRL